MAANSSTYTAVDVSGLSSGFGNAQSGSTVYAASAGKPAWLKWALLAVAAVAVFFVFRALKKKGGR